MFNAISTLFHIRDDIIVITYVDLEDPERSVVLRGRRVMTIPHDARSLIEAQRVRILVTSLFRIGLLSRLVEQSEPAGLEEGACFIEKEILQKDITAREPFAGRDPEMFLYFEEVLQRRMRKKAFPAKTIKQRFNELRNLAHREIVGGMLVNQCWKQAQENWDVHGNHALRASR